MKNFFNAPYQFSFKDVLAIFFTGTFLFVTFKATKSKDALEVMKTLIPLISIVLGGYFGQEMVSAYFQSKSPYPPNYYGGYYGGYYPLPQQAADEQQTENNPTI
ncbi:hypothetical protein TthWC1_2490 [Thermoanaerobacter thermohydrosulfuricus WC1]|uniref:Uncharacterized protein n=1 Tax=Thermoanaerobacter thermohydrosulfuricus WC1 TaxID=1198630 RepID=M8DD92_THETY|nr:hypothetical protein [Thermoanaerobacter thermohydrosulfuricus]EMT38007.1 hypothetical protein TthWC1_2490 [Thermoanaerobacter thermohydrosulfuricus WC1]